MTSAFLETMGESPRNKVLEYFVECNALDVAISDIIEEYNLNKATTYNLINKLLSQKIIIPTKKVGNTQLYRLNKENHISQILMNIMNDSIARVAEEYRKKEKQVVTIKSKLKVNKK